MGGPGSSRWRGHRRRRLVEETACLDLLDPELKEARKLPTASGELDLRLAGMEEPAVAVDFELGPVEPDGTRRAYAVSCRTERRSLRDTHAGKADAGLARVYRLPRQTRAEVA